MRAARYEQFGTAREVLNVDECAVPTPGPGEVLVQLAFSGINPTDVKARSGRVPRVIDEFQIPHHDGSGIIKSVGEGVDSSLIISAMGRAPRNRCVLPSRTITSAAGDRLL